MFVLLSLGWWRARLIFVKMEQTNGPHPPPYNFQDYGRNNHGGTSYQVGSLNFLTEGSTIRAELFSTYLQLTCVQQSHRVVGFDRSWAHYYNLNSVCAYITAHTSGTNAEMTVVGSRWGRRTSQWCPLQVPTITPYIPGFKQRQQWTTQLLLTTPMDWRTAASAMASFGEVSSQEPKRMRDRSHRKYSCQLRGHIDNIVWVLVWIKCGQR